MSPSIEKELKKQKETFHFLEMLIQLILKNIFRISLKKIKTKFKIKYKNTMPIIFMNIPKYKNSNGFRNINEVKKKQNVPEKGH